MYALTERGTYQSPALALVEFIHRLFSAEGPIHEDVLCLHTREVLHLKSFTTPKKKLISTAVEQLAENGRVALDGEFFDLPDRPCRYARRPFPGLISVLRGLPLAL